MAQLILRNVEPELKRELERRAEANGRNLDAEICEIIRTALDEEDRKTAAQSVLGPRRADRNDAGCTKDR